MCTAPPENMSTLDVHGTAREKFFDEQTAAFPTEGKWLGTSDIIESVFGKYKTFSQRASIKGVGKMVLTIPVFTGPLTPTKVGQAVEAVRCVDVNLWIKDNLGVSLFAKRRQALGAKGKTKYPVNLFHTNFDKAVGF